MTSKTLDDYRKTGFTKLDTEDLRAARSLIHQAQQANYQQNYPQVLSQSIDFLEIDLPLIMDNPECLSDAEYLEFLDARNRLLQQQAPATASLSHSLSLRAARETCESLTRLSILRQVLGDQRPCPNGYQIGTWRGVNPLCWHYYERTKTRLNRDLKVIEELLEAKSATAA